MTELRCVCKRKPLLALCGTDTKTGQPFVHLKSIRKGILVDEVVVTEGVVRIRCRECYHWHTVKIVKREVTQTQEPLPVTIAV